MQPWVERVPCFVHGYAVLHIRHCMEFTITKDENAQKNKMLLFLNKKLCSPYLVSVVNVNYFIACFRGGWG